MAKHYNLIDIGFKDFSDAQKRYFFMILDIAMKRYHQQGYLIDSFDPKNIYYEDEKLFFDKISRMSPINSNDKEAAVLNNILGLSVLAFSSYLPDYDLKNGLLNLSVISDSFDRFQGIFNEVDRNYYRSVLVDGYKQKKLPKIPYYYDYAADALKNSGSKSDATGVAFVKATQAGKLYADNDQAAFGNSFFFITIVASMLVLLVGFVLYFINIV